MMSFNAIEMKGIYYHFIFDLCVGHFKDVTLSFLSHGISLVEMFGVVIAKSCISTNFFPVISGDKLAFSYLY